MNGLLTVYGNMSGLSMKVDSKQKPFMVRSNLTQEAICSSVSKTSQVAELDFLMVKITKYSIEMKICHLFK